MDTAYDVCIRKVQIFIRISICILPSWRYAHPHFTRGPFSSYREPRECV